MTQKEIILELFASIHNQKGWFVTINDAVSDLTPESAEWNSGTENHSIWQVVHHLIFWNRRWLDRFKGIKLQKMEGDNKSTFSIASSTDDWENTTRQIDEILSGWYNAIKEKEETELLKPVVEGEPDNWYLYLHTLAMHNAYHIGQIVTLRKTQGSWDPDQGVAS
jgi:uncharacterized damage-inducible protein DinB